MEKISFVQIIQPYLGWGEVLQSEGNKLTIKLDMRIVSPVRLPLVIIHLREPDMVQLVATEAEVLEVSEKGNSIVRFTVDEK